MLRPHTTRTIALFLTICLVGASLATAAIADQPRRYNPRSLDGALATVHNPVDGRTWSAWAYRAGAEYDIAISYRDDSGVWSEPVFLGAYDRRDQVHPALVADPAGNLYLAYTDRSSGAVLLTALRAGSESWFDPVPVTLADERGHMPALSVVRDRLVVAFRSGNGIVIRDFPLLSLPYTGGSINDHPDPFGMGGDGGSAGGGGDDDDDDDDGGASGSSNGGLTPFLPSGGGGGD